VKLVQVRAPLDGNEFQNEMPPDRILVMDNQNNLLMSDQEIVEAFANLLTPPNNDVLDNNGWLVL